MSLLVLRGALDGDLALPVRRPENSSCGSARAPLPAFPTTSATHGKLKVNVRSGQRSCRPEAQPLSGVVQVLLLCVATLDFEILLVVTVVVKPAGVYAVSPLNVPKFREPA